MSLFLYCKKIGSFAFQKISARFQVTPYLFSFLWSYCPCVCAFLCDQSNYYELHFFIELSHHFPPNSIILLKFTPRSILLVNLNN